MNDESSLEEGLNDGLSKSTAELVEKSIKGFFNTAKDFTDQQKVKFITGFSEYINKEEQRLSNTKTIINRVDAVPIKAIYEPLRFELEAKKYSENDILYTVQKCGKAVITGIGGCGKSMTAKMTFLSILRKRTFLPVFIELRQVNFSESNLITHISKQLNTNSIELSEKGLKYGLSSGKILLILDGFDEISVEQRKQAQKQIIKLSDEYPRCGILVTGRPDQRYQAWHNFSEYRVLELTEDQVIQVVKRSRYDIDIKRQFLAKLEDGFYKKGRQLLKNPLLVYLMLMTTTQIREGVGDAYLYYQKAFDVLIEQHDNLKPDFTRQYECGEDLQIITNLFENFCFFSFMDNKFDFKGDQEFKLYSKNAIEYSNIKEITEEKFLSDVTNNICIIHKEGVYYNFLHRSFQEYFVANFILTRHVKDFYGLCEVIGTSIGSNVFDFMFDMNQEVLEREYILPKLKKIRLGIGRKKLNYKILENLFHSIDLNKEKISFSIYVGRGHVAKTGSFLFEVMRRYPEHKIFDLGEEAKIITTLGLNIKEGQHKIVDVSMQNKDILEQLGVGLRIKQWIDNVILNLQETETERIVMQARAQSIKKMI